VARFVGQGRQGDPGDRGGPCASCGEGQRSHRSSSSQEFDNWVRDCRAGGAAASNYGQPGGRGHDGVGATIIVRAREILGSFECTLEPGAGGTGGARGIGRWLCDQECGPEHRETECAPSPDPNGQGAPGSAAQGTCTIEAYDARR
jgi:hypothetical protein